MRVALLILLYRSTDAGDIDVGNFVNGTLQVKSFDTGIKMAEVKIHVVSRLVVSETGVDVIEKETLRLATLLRKGLEQKNYIVHSPYSLDQHRSAMVNFIPKAETLTSLKNIPCNFAVRGPGVRLSPAAFSSDEIISRVLSVL